MSTTLNISLSAVLSAIFNAKVWIVGFVATMYFCWMLFLAYASFKAAKDDGRVIPKITIALYAPAGALSYLIDIVILNVVIGTILFMELPKTLTFTDRCSSHLGEEGWRGALARWICQHLLDPFQTGGHCHK